MDVVGDPCRDVVALEVALGLGLAVRRMVGSWFTAAIGVEQYFAVAVGILLLPVVTISSAFIPGYLLGTGGAIAAEDSRDARGVWRTGRVGQHRRARSIVARSAAGDVRLRADVASSGRIAGAEGPGGPQALGDSGGHAGRGIDRKAGGTNAVGEPQLGLVPIAFLDNRPEAWNQAMENVPVAGPLGLAQDFERRAEAAIVALADLERDDVGGPVAGTEFSARDRDPAVHGGRKPMGDGARSGRLPGSGDQEKSSDAAQSALKRMMDRLIAMPLFLLSIPAIGRRGVDQVSQPGSGVSLPDARGDRRAAASRYGNCAQCM